MGKNKFLSSTYNRISTKHPSQFLTNISHYVCKNYSLNKIHSIRGISPLSFVRGSMTVEAAMVLPLFLFCFLNLFLILNIYSLQTTLMAALRETGQDLCVYGYAYERMVQEEDDEGLEAFAENIAFSYSYVKYKVENYCGKEYLEQSPLSYGRKGLVYADSSVLQQGDIVDLVVSYRVSPLIDLAGFRPKWFYSRYYGRAWTGYDVEAAKREEMVYVAEYARVFHKESSCTYINLSVHSVTADALPVLTNAEGKHYKPCETCRPDKEQVLYITQEGNHYHGNAGCRGLKRTVYMAKRKDVEGSLSPCGRCYP